MGGVRAREFVVAWVGGAVLSGVPSTAWTLVRGGSLLESTRAAGSLLGRPTVVRGAVAHLAISAWWTWVLVRVLRVRGPVAGAAAGGAIAGLDLFVIGPRYPLIRALSMPPQIADHLAFGAVVGWLSRRRRLSDPSPN